MNTMENNDITTPKRPRRHSSPIVMGAQIISDIFVPLLVPTYAMALAMWFTSLRTLPERSRVYVTIFVAILTGLIPMICILAMQRLGMVSDNSISNRRQRPLPMIVTMVCYVLTGFMLTKMHAPAWLVFFFFGASAATAIAAIITLFWKISAHSTSIGGFVGMLFWFAVAGLADVNAMALLTVGIIIAGAVCTSRLILHRHTLGQVLAGFFLGLACTFGLDMLILH